MLDSVQALLEGAIDYAGLFPPAGLGMQRAVEDFSRYRIGEDNWMLGRFVVPVARLSEFETAIIANPPPERIKASVLVGTDLAGSIPAILAFNAHVRDAAIDSIEAKAEVSASIVEHAHAVPDGFVTYFEISAEPDPEPAIQAVAEANARAKIRTGGVKPEMFPTVEQVARFIRRCDEAKVAFKATAGLHHPIRGVHPLTYESDAPSSTMHGFLNVLLAAAFLWSGVPDSEMQQILEAPADHFRFSDRGIEWTTRWISIEQIRTARQRLVISFGSCSFDEPRTELLERGLL